MAKTSQFIIVPADKSYCSKCMTKVQLLCHDSGEMRSKPAFYICTGCGHVAQVGVGPLTGKLRIRRLAKKTAS